MAVSLALPAATWSATTGFNQTGAGPYDYNATSNWVDGTINGLWDTTLSIAVNQNVTFADTTLATGLTFNHGGNFGLTMKAETAGVRTLTLGGDVRVNTGGGTSANVIFGDASSKLDVDLGGVTRTMTVAASRTLSFLNVISNGSLTKAGGGTLTLQSSGVNTFTGGVTINTGWLIENFGSLSVAANLIDSNNALTFALAGGMLTLSGKSSTSNSQSFNGTALNSGDITITAAPGGSGTLTLSLGAITRSAGSAVNFSSGSGGSITISTSSANDATGILGTWAAVGSGSGTRYATVSGGAISGYTGGTAAATAANLTETAGAGNYDLAAGGTAGSGFYGNTVRYTGGAGTITASGSISMNGLMNTGSGLLIVTGGTFPVGANKELVVNSANNSITISGTITDNAGGSSSLVKTGAQQLTLSANNSFSGGVTMGAGQLNLGHGGALGTGTLTINGGLISDNGTTFTILTNIPIVLNGSFTKPDSAGRVLNFGTGAVTLKAPITITSNGHPTQFGGTISGPGGLNALDIGATGGNNSGVIFTAPVTLRPNQTVTTTSAGYLRFDGVIGDGGSGYGFNVSGTVQLNGNNTFTGPLVINSGGAVIVAANGSSGSMQPGTITINSGGSLILGTQNLGNGGSISTNSVIINNGVFRLGDNTAYVQGVKFPAGISGTGSLDISGTRVNYVTLSGVNTYSGGTRVVYTGGGGPVVLNINSATAIGTGTLTLSKSGGDNATIDNTSGSPVTLSSNNPQSWNGPITFTGSNALDLGTGAVTLANNPTMNVTASTLTVGGIIGGSSALAKAGNGTLALAGANTYSGGTTLSGGILKINAENNLGSGGLIFNGGTLLYAAVSPWTISSCAVALSGAGHVDTSLANGTIASAISGSGSLNKVGSGTLVLTGLNTYTGSTKVIAGTLVIGNALALQYSVFDTSGAAGGLDVSGMTSLTLGGLSGGSLSSAVTGFGGITALTLQTLSGSVSYTGSIEDGAAGMTLTKTGAGTQTFSGNLTYTGTTTVNQGLLQINGSLTSSAVIVNGGYLGGTGTITQNVTLGGAGGIDLRNNATGVLAINGNLAINGVAGANNFYFDLGNNTAAADTIIVNGSTTMATTKAGVITLNQLGSPNRVLAGTYPLIQGIDSVLATDFTLTTTKAFGSLFTLGLDSGNLVLTTSRLTGGVGSATWTGGSDSSWLTAGNWSGSAVPDYQTAVTFYGAPNTYLTTTLDADFDIASLTYASGATLSTSIGSGSGGMLTIEGASGITQSAAATHTISANVGIANNTTFTVAAGGTLTISGSLSDFGGDRTLRKAVGTGVLNLNGSTTVGSLYAGFNVASSAGTVVVGSGGTLSVGYGPASMLLVGVNGWDNGLGTGTLDVSAGSFLANVGNFFVGVCATGLTTPKTGNGSLMLGNSNITAQNFVVGGTEPDGNSGASNGGTVTIASGATVNILTPVMAMGTTKSNNGGTFKMLGAGTLSLGSGSTRTALYIGRHLAAQTGNAETGNMDLSTGTASLYLSGLFIAKNINGTASGSSTTSGTLTLSGDASNNLNISGPGNVVQIGYYDGLSGFTVAGNLIIGNAGTQSEITSTDNNTAILIAYKPSGTCSGTLTMQGGMLTITTTGSAIAGGGGTSRLNLKDCTLAAGASSTNWITGLTSATLTNTVTFSSGTNSITVPQALSGNGSLVKAGAGTMTLSGTNTYTGATTVSNGTLLVSGSITSAVTVVSGGAVGGTGTISNNVTLLSGAQAVFTQGSPMQITGALTLNGNVVRVNLPNALEMGTLYPLATYDPTGSTGSFAQSGVIESGTAGGVPVIVTDNGTVYVKIVQQGTMISIE